MKLQKHILAAANLKQPWFFNKLYQKYIELVKQLKDVQLPTTVSLFVTTEFGIRTICKMAQYSEIKITTEADSERLLNFGLMMLSHFVSDLEIVKSDLSTEAVNVVLRVLQDSAWSIKVECVEFCYKFFKAQDAINNSSMRLLIDIIRICAAVCGQNETVSVEELDRFDKTLMKLFEVARILPITSTSGPEHLDFVYACLQFDFNKKGLKFQFKSVAKSWRNCLGHFFSDNKNFSDKLDLAIASTLEETDNLHIISLFLERMFIAEANAKESNSWKFLYRKINNTIYGTETGTELLPQYLDMIIVLDKTYATGFLGFDTTDINEGKIIIEKILSVTGQNLQSGRIETEAGLSIISKLLQLKLIQSLEDIDQCHLFETMIFSLSPLLKLNFRMPPGILEHFCRQHLSQDDPEGVAFIINLITKLNTLYIGDSLKNKIRLLLENIMIQCTQLPPYILDEFLKALPLLLRKNMIQCGDKLNRFLQEVYTKKACNETLTAITIPLICTTGGDYDESDGKLICKICKAKDKTTNSDDILYKYFLRFIQSENDCIKMHGIYMLPNVTSHYSGKVVESLESIMNAVLCTNDAQLLTVFAEQIPCLSEAILKRPALLDRIIKDLTVVVKKTLDSAVLEPFQQATLEIVQNIASIRSLDMDSFLRLFKIHLLYLVRVESMVVAEAMLACEELCAQRHFKPRNMFNWYKTSILRLVVALIVAIYLQHNVPLVNALGNVAKLFGYFSSQTFIVDHHQLIVAQLLPFVVKVTCLYFDSK